MPRGNGLGRIGFHVGVSDDVFRATRETWNGIDIEWLLRLRIMSEPRYGRERRRHLSGDQLCIHGVHDAHRLAGGKAISEDDRPSSFRTVPSPGVPKAAIE